MLPNEDAQIPAAGKKKNQHFSKLALNSGYIDDAHYAFLKITPSQTPSCNWSGATEGELRTHLLHLGLSRHIAF